MATSVTFETATIADAIKKAERIAPDKGMAFDKAAGIVIEVHPADEAVVVRATDLMVFYMEWVDSLQITGDKVIWRFPSRVFASFIASLAIGNNKQVTFTTDGAKVLIQQGRATAKLNTIQSEYYPDWPAFDEADMVSVPELGGRLAQVEWAAHKSEHALGIRFTGEYVLAMDRQRLAVAPLVIPGLEEPFTIPPRLLTGVLRERGETKIKREGTQLLLMPDDKSQLRTIMIGEGYPGVERLMDRDRTESIKFMKQPVIDMINRTVKIAAADRFPTLRIFIGQGEIAALMTDDEKGLIGDVVEIPGQANHKRCEYLFVPENILEAISNSPSDEVEMRYSPGERKLIYINGGSGYECWVTPRTSSSPKGES